MTWDEKLISTMHDYRSTSKLKIVFRSFAPAALSYVVELRKRFPFLDADYTRFLSLTDGASLWMYEFCGSGASKMPALGDLYTRWRTNVEKLGVFPFAEDPRGNCISMRVNGEIISSDCRAESDSDCIVLAASFAELAGDILMGQNFYSLFDVPRSDIEDNEWLEYLRQKGWLSNSDNP